MKWEFIIKLHFFMSARWHYLLQGCHMGPGRAERSIRAGPGRAGPDDEWGTPGRPDAGWARIYRTVEFQQ